MIRTVFFVGVAIITIIVFIAYYVQERDHQRELDKIKIYEDKYNKRQRELEIIRHRTVPCHIPDLSNPKQCYIDSNYQCTWNDEAERCDKK